MTSQRRLFIGSRLDRYVGAHFFGSYCTTLGLMVGMFMILDLAGKVDHYFEPWKDGTQVAFSTVLLYGVLNLPYQFLQIAPFVTLIAGMFTVNRLLRKNEVVAMLSAGVSVHRLLLSVYIGGAVIGLGMFALREGVRFGFAEERDIRVGDPNTMSNRGVAVEEAEIVHVLHQGLTVELLPRHRLHLGFQNMGVEGGAILLRQPIRRFHQLDGAALRP